MQRFRFVRRLVPAALMLTVVSCDGGEGVMEPPRQGDIPVSINIMGDTEVNIGGALQLTAVVKDSSGVTVSATVTWASLDNATATVDSAGNVLGMGRGTVTIQASTEGASGSITDTHDVTVRIAAITVLPDSAVLTSLGDTLQLIAEAKDEQGDTVAGVSFTFTTSDSSVVTVDDAGMVVAVANGAATVMVSGDGRTAQAAVVVAQVAATVVVVPDSVVMDALEVDTALAATVTDARGNAIVSPNVFWTSSDSAVATVDSSTGTVRSKGNGIALIVASSEAVADSASVTVQQVAVGFVVLPDSVRSTAFGDTLMFTAASVDRNNQPVGTAAATWFSTNTAVATVDQGGNATSVGNGTTYIRAEASGLLDSAVLVVEQIARQMVVDPASQTFASLGDTATLSATATDANGNTISGPSITWSSSASAVATVGQDGLVTALANGSAVISATTDSASGSGGVTVSQVATTLSVSPTVDTLVSFDATRDFTATATDALGNPVTDSFTWTSINTAVATVSGITNVATATAVSNGTATIRVARDGLAADATLVVQQEVASVAVSPSSATIVETLTQQFTASPEDANGNPVEGASVVWSSSNTAVAIVDGAGLVTGESFGTATITASSEGVDGSATITVEILSLSEHVQPIFTNRCALSGCHIGAYPEEGLDLSGGNAHSNTVNVLSVQSPLLRIKPSEPDSSYLVHKIEGTQGDVGGSGSQMPKTGCCLSQSQIDLIRAWIQKGANN